MRKGKITVLIHIPGRKKFLKTEMRNEYTKAMYDYTQQFKDDSKRLNYKQMMSHDRKRKCGSGGVRLGKFCGQITDYECTKILCMILEEFIANHNSLWQNGGVTTERRITNDCI